MPARKAVVPQADIARALKAARDAGFQVARYEVGPDGRIIVYTTAMGGGEQLSDWDRP
jgi:hypothetical protein